MGLGRLLHIGEVTAADRVTPHALRMGRDRDETGQTWINPSPNMRSLNEATLYPGIGLLETTNLSVGRGTDTPFSRAVSTSVERAAEEAGMYLRQLELEEAAARPRRHEPEVVRARAIACRIHKLPKPPAQTTARAFAERRGKENRLAPGPGPREPLRGKRFTSLLSWFSCSLAAVGDCRAQRSESCLRASSCTC